MFFKSKNPDQEVSITVSTSTFVRLALLTAGAILLFQFFRQASHSLMLICVAFFLALALNAPVHWLSQHLPVKKKNSRTLATTISFLVVVAFLGLFLASIVPPLVKQTSNFVDAAPTLIKDFRSQDSATGRFIRQYNLETQVDEASDQLAARLKASTGHTFSALQTIGSSLFAILAVLVLTFMMLIEGPKWVEFTHKTIPRERRAASKRIANDMYRVVKGFVNGQVLLAFIAAVLIFPAILTLGISYPIALMVVVFVCGLIPMVGHTIGALIVTLVALFESSTAAIIILSYYILYQQLENYFVQPKIQANATNMSPLLVFMAVLIGASFGGLAAAIFAIPLAGILRILALEYMHANNMITEKVYENEVKQPAAK